jgi:predicted transcriptional regulator
MRKTQKRPARKLDKRLTHAELNAELDAAEASIARGESVPHAAVVKWAQSLGTARPLPRPVPRKRPLRAS